jgi:LmbE family N-acetylglucosaminyl deacetylase
MLELAPRQAAGRGLRVLCLGAHCDDIEIGCGATILSLLTGRDDVVVRWIVLSSDEQRAKEARASAEMFLAGAQEKEVIIRAYRDGFFPAAWGPIKEEFEQLKRAYQPDLILTPHRDDLHQDHRVVSELTWNTFRNHLILEYEIPKYDGDRGAPNLFVPLAESLCRQKVSYLMEAFSSQETRQWFSEEVFFASLRLRGVECNARYAEAFHCRKAVLGIVEP